MSFFLKEAKGEPSAKGRSRPQEETYAFTAELSYILSPVIKGRSRSEG